ncbi:MAG TPA: hypothetical protein VJC37_00850 [Planctomycetota bacterium]|nr:hypothetical protein [Planctomycetota bacterium]
MLSKGYLISAGIIVFWLVMTGLFIRREILPSLPSLDQPSYEAYLKSQVENQSIKMGIYFKGERIGSSQTDIEPLVNNETKIRNLTTISLPSMMEIMLSTNRRTKKAAPPDTPRKNTKSDTAKMVFSGYSLVDAKYKLKSFSFSAQSPFLNYAISGQVKDDLMEITLSDGLKSSTNYLPYKGDSTVSDGLSPFVSMPYLTVGKEWSINYINPFGASMQTLKARVESRTQIEWQNQMNDVYEVVLSEPGTAKSPLNYTAYITPEGKILRQEILLPGLYLLRE